MNGVRASAIPIVDLRDYLAGSAAGRAAAAADICAALEGIGFFGIANHGVPGRAVEAAFAASQCFFDLPLADKMAVRVNMGHRGYLPMADQHRADAAKPNLSESYLIGPDLAEDDPAVVEGRPLHGVNPWPDAPDGFRDALGGFHAAMSALGLRLLPLFETALDLPDGYFAACYRNPMGFVRSLHYPPAPAEADPDRFGAAPHSDFGFITILAQDDVGGLQVQTRAGDWIDAPNRPGVFLVNIGDMLMRWTNDRFRSTVHRVLNAPGRDRYSLPFFFDPDFETEVSCLESCTGPGNPPRYDPVVWGDFLTASFNANHAYRKKAG